ncbi:isoleucine--tRNA ligase [Sandaracinus amylolyticus]|uniref:Isoleucine--tRNA ligase n=1 Tax=Sandaracinus amylolyticus TaxID=927083 RepID=A0A0F6SFA0_9BACT|nr:isoleucine--tRNA ligase [Sandaracinus amylolyticus]AKF06579.1 Isoleucyl-tRNA synthetase [Sandaracinus amylolyticus]
MPFEPVPQKVSFPDLERRFLDLWQRERIFERSVESSEGKPPFVFFEGPPTANGMPHPGHVLTRVMKDVFLRYRSMTGWHVPRRGGWDTHGLPVEVEVEKALGISGRQAIEAYGVEAFTHRCIESVFRYIDEWRKMTQRIAFWVDLDAAYVTFHKPYVESVWWALKTLFDKGLLYQDYKIVWWWPQGGTALSSGEVGQGYKEVDDPSVFVRFPVLSDSGVGAEKTSFLAWTTTPWTLPSHIALAVHEDFDYAVVEVEGERLILAQALIGKVLGDKEHRVVETKKGKDLLGTKYVPPFSYAEPEGGSAPDGKHAHHVIAADFVTLESGAGIVHVAPAFGEEDFKVCKQQGLGFLQLVRPNGTFDERVTDFAGRFCKEADRDIIRNLRQRGLLFKEEVYRHQYPFSWRRDTDPLIQYARRSWFIRTTQEISRVIENNRTIHWEPEHIQEGRFGEFLRSNVDWALSRERFWGTPLPIWINDQTGRMECIDSVEQILAKNPRAFDHWHRAKEANPSLSDHLMVHKPWVDEVTWENPGEPGVYRRVPEVIDCWFDSGCMPFAQHGYPHQNKAQFEREFPADFITEAVDQTRGWFYSLLVISTMLFEKEGYPHPFKNCVVLGLITDEKGQKLSKSKKNYKDPGEMFDLYGADAVRWALYAQSVPGQTNRWFEGGAVEAIKEFLLKVWNVYSFFVTYASIDGWTPSMPRPPISERSDFDRWILAELDQTVRDVRGSLEAYRTHPAARSLSDFIESLSNWYVRRSRARFWASGDSSDKRAAFATLYEVLVDLAKLIAPFTPFLAESLYQNLVRTDDPEAPASVHFTDFPKPHDERRDDALRRDMAAARAIVGLGARVRAQGKLKVRQALAEAIVVVTDESDRRTVERFQDAIVDELNVEKLSFTSEPEKIVQFQLVPNFRALGPKLGKHVPACKAALGKADGSALYRELESNGKIVLALPETTVELEASEVEIRLSAKEGFAAASDRGRVVVLDTHVDDALRRKGMAREAVSKIQGARKTMDLAFDARIALAWEAEGELATALGEHGAYVAGEVLATRMDRGIGAGTKHETDVDGARFTFWIEVA